MTIRKSLLSRYIGYLFLLIAVALAGACSRESSTKTDPVQLARFYADNGTYSLALSTLGQALQKNPSDSRLHQALSQVYRELGYTADALKAIDQAIARGCQALDCQEQHLRLLIDAGKTGEAARLLAELSEALPAEHKSLYRARIDYQRDGNRRQALARLKNLKLPEAQTAYLNLLFDDGAYAEILDRYQAQKGKFTTADDWLLYAKTLYLLKRHEEAGQVLIELRLADKSDVITPRKIQTVELQVKNSIAQNKFAEAQAIYDAFIENYKGSGYATMQQAVKDLRANNFDAAIKKIQGLVEVSPDNQQSALLLALAQFGKKDYQGAVNTLTLFRDKLDAPGRSLLAKALLNLRQADAVIDLIPPHAKSVSLRLDLANAWLMKGRPDRVRELLQGMDGATLKQHDLLQYGRLLTQLGEGQRFIREVKGRELKDPRLQQLFISALLEAGRTGEAQRYARGITDPRQSLDMQIYIALQTKDRKTALELQRRLTEDRQLKTDDAKLAALYLADRQLDEAFSSIQRGFTKPGDNTPLLKLLRALLQQGDRPDVLKWMASLPESVDGYDKLQLLLAEQEIRDNPEQARQRLQPLLQSNDPRAIILLARADPEHGDKILRDALERKYHPLIARLLYRYYLKQGDKPALRLLLERIEQKQKDSPEKDLLLARGYLRLGDGVRSLAFAQALEQKGRVAKGLEVRGDIELAARRWPAAAKAYEASYRHQPTDAVAVKLYQARRAGGEAAADALRAAERMLQEHPEFLALKNLVATAYLSSNPERSRKLYEDLLRTQTGNVTAMNNLAWLYLKQSPKKALELSARAYRLAPGNLQVADTYLRALVRNGQRGKARDLFERLRKQHPNDPALDKLARQLS